MAQIKMTVILLPDDECYQVIFPHYPNCITFGATVEEALANAQEAIELLLEEEATRRDWKLPPNVHPNHVVVGEVEVEVPDSIIEVEEQKQKSDATPYESYAKLDLGPGGYATAPSTETRRGMREAARRKRPKS